MQYTDIIKSDKNGIISFKFNTRVNNEDRSGIYTVYLKSEDGKIVTKKYSYGFVSAGDITYKNSAGEVVTDISLYSGQNLTMSCEVENGTDSSITPCIITAFYNDGTLKQVSSNSDNSIDGMTSKNIEWNVTVADSFKKVQVMFMDSLVTLKPLTKVRVIYEVVE